MFTKTDYRTQKNGDSTQITELDKGKIDKIVKTRQFEPEIREPINRYFHIFRFKGDSITGILGPPVVNFRRNTSYPITKDDSSVVEIFGNKLLHETIRKHDLIGKKIRIVYIGRQHGPWGRPRKIYRVYVIAGVFTESETSVPQPKIKKKKRRKKNV